MRKLLVSACLLGGMVVGMGSARAAPAARAGGKAAEPESGPVKVKLTVSPLPAPQFTLSGAMRGASLYQGAVMPNQAAQFGGSEGPVSAVIAGVPVSFMRSGQMLGMKVENTQPIVLQKAGIGCRPVQIKGKNGPYLISFPFAFTGTAHTSLYYCSGFVMRGTLAGHPVLLYDNDMDGVFTQQDTLRVVAGGTGSACALAPISKFLATPSGLYQINSIAENGAEMEVERIAGETGKLAFAFNAEEAELHAAFGSKQAQLNFVAVANPRNGSELVVAPGKYELLYGMVYAPRMNAIVASVRPGKLAAIDASAGDKPQRVALGGPYVLSFSYRMNGGQLVVNPSTFRVAGQGGEEYTGVKYTAAEIGLVSGNRSVRIGKMAFG